MHLQKVETHPRSQSVMILYGFFLQKEDPTDDELKQNRVCKYRLTVMLNNNLMDRYIHPALHIYFNYLMDYIKNREKGSDKISL